MSGSPNLHSACDLIRQQYLCCPACCDVLKNPRTLPTCGHTACLECLVLPHEVPAEILCPSCGINSGLTGFDALHLSVDDEVSQLLTTLDAVQVMMPACSMCHAKASVWCAECEDVMCSQGCTDLHARFYPKHKVSTLISSKETNSRCCNCDASSEYHCMECDEMLCSICVQVHNKLGMNRGHKISRLSSGKDIGLTVNYFVPCAKGCEKGIRMFCDDCSMLFCETCFANEHCGHGVQKLANKEEEVLRNLEHQQASHRTLHSEALACRRVLDSYNESVLEQFSAFSFEVKRSVQKIKRCLQEIEHSMLEGAREVLKIEQIEQDRRTVEDYVNTTNQSLTLISQMLACSSSKQMLPLIVFVNNKLSQLQHGPVIDTNTGRLVQVNLDLPVSDLKSSLKKELGAMKIRETSWVTPQTNSSGTLSELADEADVIQCELMTSKQDLNAPWISGIACSKDGHLFAVDRNNKKVKNISANIKLMSEFHNNLLNPFDVALYGDNLLAVTDTKGCSVQIYDHDGVEIDNNLTCPRAPSGIASSGRELVICDAGNQLIHFSNDEMDGFDLECQESGKLSTDYKLCHVAINKNIVAVCSNNQHCIQVYSSKGRLLRTLGCYGNNLGELASPRGVAIDNYGNVLVADTLNHRIQAFMPDGRSKVVASATNSITNPHALTLDQQGHLLVSHGRKYGHVQYISRLKYLKEK